jgi:hypothetical protein
MNDKAKKAKARKINPLIAYVYDYTPVCKVPVACVAALSPNHIGVCFSKTGGAFDRAFIRSQAIGRAAMDEQPVTPNRKINHLSDDGSLKKVTMQEAISEAIDKMVSRTEKYYR